MVANLFRRLRYDRKSFRYPTALGDDSLVFLGRHEAYYYRPWARGSFNSR